MRKILYIIPLFIFAFTFTGGPPSGWYKQTIQGPLGGVVRDMTFTDSLVGFIITDSTIFKTTNGGDNWTAKFNDKLFKRIQFVNANVGFIAAGLNLYKTTNAGENWFAMTLPLFLFPDDLSALNEDSIWLSDDNGFSGGIFRTTDGGQNWEQQYGNKTGGNGPEKIYMYNGKLGFMTDDHDLYRTSNSGINWTQVTVDDDFTDMEFVDSLTGWKANLDIKKTTNGGLNWQTQIVPTGGWIFNNAITKIALINNDTIWGVGGNVLFEVDGFTTRGIIWRTTNGGINWGYQLPDTSFGIGIFNCVSFTDNRKGWAYSQFSTSGIHTVTGGSDTTYYTSISQVSSEIPDKFLLHQNYPNPFNPATIIRYEIKQNTKVKLNIYDITGRDIAAPVNEKLSAGEYSYTFDATGLPSGIYFYRLSADGTTIDTKKMMLVK